MINANELRIGSLISHHGEHLKVNGIEYYAGKKIVSAKGEDIMGEFEFSKVDGIPLTPEILEKAGFVYRNEHRGKGAIMDFNKQSIGIAEDKFVYLTAWQAPCKYLHQLQNLYFALTEKELPITNL